MNIIVASGDADQLNELVNGAYQVGQRMKPRVQVDVRFAMSLEQLLKKRNSQTGLVIVAASLPQARSSSAAEPEPGLSFAKSLALEAAPPACIVVSHREELYRTIQAIRRCELLTVDSSTNYVEECIQLARRLNVIPDDPAMTGEASLVATIPVERNRPAVAATKKPVGSGLRQNNKYALLEVELPTDAGLGIVYLELHEEPGKIKRNQNRPLRLNQCELEELIKDSRILKDNLSKWQQDPVKWKRHYDEWHAEYRKLGERVARLLWGSQSFREYYYRGDGWAEGNIRVRFNLEEPWFDGLWEAISAEREDRNLILDNTLARRAIPQNKLEEVGGTAAQIDTDDGTLNILVIQSEVTHNSVPQGPDDPLWRKYWASYKGTLPMLPHLAQEVAALRDLETSRRRSGSSAKLQVNVDVLPKRAPPPGQKWSLADKVEKYLGNESRRYDIVHFAGHALFADGPVKDDERGYLVFSGFPHPEAVPIARVASWLKHAGTQLVYLSCCRSSAASAALEFARYDIPMAIGFHWDLDDSKAPVFAKRFYQELLDAKLKVCPAISRARRKLFEHHDRGDPIWASPVLIAQPKDWVAIEGVLKLAAKEEKNDPAARGARPNRKPPPAGQDADEAA
jgi:hypothetical protein